MNHYPWSDDIEEGRPPEIPDERFRPDRFLFLEDDNIETGESRDKMPVDVSHCRQKYKCLTDTFRLLRNKCNDDREFLIRPARDFLKLKYVEMENIFRLDSSNLCRIANQVNKDLQRKR